MIGPRVNGGSCWLKPIRYATWARRKANRPIKKKRGLSIRAISPASEKSRAIPNQIIPPSQPVNWKVQRIRKKSVAGFETYNRIFQPFQVEAQSRKAKQIASARLQVNISIIPTGRVSQPLQRIRGVSPVLVHFNAQVQINLLAAHGFNFLSCQRANFLDHFSFLSDQDAFL